MKAWTVACVAFLPLIGMAQTDQLRLKSGTTFEGRIVAETPKSVTIQLAGGVMELRRELIAEIKRAEASESRPEQSSVLAGLTRFRDSEDAFFLYQSGKRVGYRTVSLRRDVRKDVAGYLRIDRMVFTATNGGPPDLDLVLTEFVDSELTPRSFEQRLLAGVTSRLAEGVREGDFLRITERAGATVSETQALFRKGVELPGFLWGRLALEATPNGGFPTFRVFDPKEIRFDDVVVTRNMERVSLQNEVRDVIVLRRKSSEQTTEVWFDLMGRLMREELGTRNLVALRTTAENVRAFAAGDAKAGADDLGLSVSCDDSGLRLQRPDPSWEVQAGDPAKHTIASLVKAGWRATVDVFDLRTFRRGTTEEDAAMRVIGRLQRGTDGFSLVGPTPGRFGATEGLRFIVDGKRRGTTLKTLGFLVPRRDRCFVLLCSAPAEKYDEAHPAFLRVLQSLQMQAERREDEPVDPYATAESDVNRLDG